MMRVLTAGFDRDTTDQIADWLREGGHEVLGATGRSSSRTLARVARPSLVLVPAEDAGVKAKEWLEDLLIDVPMVVLAANLAGKEALLDALQATVDGSPLSESHRDQGLERTQEAPADENPIPEQETPVATSSADETPWPRAQTVHDEAEASIEATESESSMTTGDLIPATPEQGARSPLPSTKPSAALPVEGATKDLSVGFPEGQPNLEAKLEAVRYADYYAVLGLEPSASAFEIRQKADTLTTVYAPAGWPAPLGADALPKLEEIAQGIRDAYTVLGDPRQRERYDSARAEC